MHISCRAVSCRGHLDFKESGRRVLNNKPRDRPLSAHKTLSPCVCCVDLIRLRQDKNS